MDINKLILDLKKEYCHKMEMHIHTSPVSSCSALLPKDIVQKYAALGYSAIAITNHFQPKLLKMSEDDAVNFYANDFYEAELQGKKMGIKVILGAEITFAQSPSDYLVFGLDEDGLRQIYRHVGSNIAEYYKDCKTDKNFIIQAHPFRKGQIFTPNVVDGVEAYNLHPWHNSGVSTAVQYASFSQKMRTIGNDVHQDTHEGLTATLLRRIPEDSFDFAKILQENDFLMAISDDIVLSPRYNQ